MKHYKDYIKENKLKNKTFEELSEEEIERFNKYRDMSLINNLGKDKLFRKFSKEYEKHKFSIERFLKIFDTKIYQVPRRKEGITSSKSYGEAMCHNNSQLLSHIIDNSKYVRGYMISFRDNKVWLISHSVWLSPEKKMIEVTDYNSGLLNCNDTAFIPLYILERNEDCVTPNLKFNKVNLQISKTIELNFYQEGLFSKQKLTEILKQLKSPLLNNNRVFSEQEEQDIDVNVKSLLSDKTLKDFLVNKNIKLVENYSEEELKRSDLNPSFLKYIDNFKSNTKTSKWAVEYSQRFG